MTDKEGSAPNVSNELTYDATLDPISPLFDIQSWVPSGDTHRVPASALVRGDMVRVNIAPTPMHEPEVMFAHVQDSLRRADGMSLYLLIPTSGGKAVRSAHYLVSHDHEVTVRI